MRYVEVDNKNMELKNEDGTYKPNYTLKLAYAVAYINRYNEMVVGDTPKQKLKLKGVVQKSRI